VNFPLKFSDPTGQLAHSDCIHQAVKRKYRLYITEVAGHCLNVHPNRYRSYCQHSVNVIYHVEYSFGTTHRPCPTVWRYRTKQPDPTSFVVFGIQRAGHLIIKPIKCINFSNYFRNRTLNVSVSFSVHHQESSTVHTAIGYVIEVMLTAC